MAINKKAGEPMAKATKRRILTIEILLKALRTGEPCDKLPLYVKGGAWVVTTGIVLEVSKPVEHERELNEWRFKYRESQSGWVETVELTLPFDGTGMPGITPKGPNTKAGKIVAKTKIKKQPTPGADLIAKLCEARPDVAITVTAKPDHHYAQYGNDPGPRAGTGLIPHTVVVVASTIRNGRLIEGQDGMLGVYLAHGESVGEVHGCLPQMVEEAVANLDNRLRSI